MPQWRKWLQRLSATLPRNYYLGLNLARQLSLNGEYEACVNLLANPAGAAQWRRYSRVQPLARIEPDGCYGSICSQKIQKGNQIYCPVAHLRQNLGVGKPDDVDEDCPISWRVCVCWGWKISESCWTRKQDYGFPSNKNFQPAGSLTFY